MRETEIRTCKTGIVPYRVLSADRGGFRETIAPGAFTKTLQEQPAIAATVNHAPHGIRFGSRPLSIAFEVIRELWHGHSKWGIPVRELIEVRLIAITTPRPARVSAKAMETAIRKGSKKWDNAAA